MMVLISAVTNEAVNEPETASSFPGCGYNNECQLETFPLSFSLQSS
jgi:hypothetical protein